MPYRRNIFSKILMTITLLLVPVLLLYSYSNRMTQQAVEQQIQSSALNQLSFFLYQLDSNIENLSMFPVILSSDPHIREFIEVAGNPLSGLLKAQSRITEKLSLQSVSSSWSNDLSFVIPSAKKVLSSNIYINGLDQWPWERPVRTAWTYDEDVSRGQPIGTFIREISEPANVSNTQQADTVFQVRFPVQALIDQLDRYKKDKMSDPFLIHPDFKPVFNSTSSSSLTEPMIRQLFSQTLADAGQERMQIDGQDYLVSYAKSRQLGWYLIDYVPVQKMLEPITAPNNLFNISVGLLLLMGAVASYLLYRNVQIPIMTITRTVQRMKRGDLSSRIDARFKNEFDHLSQHYNEMAERIQVLIEDVYTAKIRTREATLKQLQSQINPHFLYNSLFFIINSAMMDDRDAVVAMAENLAEYYRYSTRVENQTVTVRDELELVQHYLNIHNLRMRRLTYTIDVPETMMDEPIPRLLLQPLVENAIVHGIEPLREGGEITITGEQNESFNRIVIEDNGTGLTDRELRSMQSQLQKQMTEELSHGTWNVHQRLQYQFGEGSGLTFRHGSKGGLKAVLTWNRNNEGKFHPHDEGG
ncbi:sensor histidine kinase [Paenibacillus sp. NPDC056579]|uniref:sensor histidine kinase n=1 Tax=Paenibacillus sp. NPDC056579 TaxID=3345871 RepID=UPI00369AF98E